MFQRFLSWIREAVQKLFPPKNIQAAIKMDIPISEKMSGAITLWSQMFEDRPPWAKNGVISVGIPAAVAGELGRLATIELQSAVTGGSARAQYLDQQYQPVVEKLRGYAEQGCAAGCLVFKPYINGTEIDVDCVRAENFFPVSFNARGNVTACVFVEQVQRSGITYTRLEYHAMERDGYRVRNLAFESRVSGSLGTPVTLDKVEEWAELEPETVIQTDCPLFAVFRFPTVNNVDPVSPLGVSCYSRAVNLIRQADEQWEKIMWEYEATAAAVHASIDLFKQGAEGEATLPKGKERLYRLVDLDLMTRQNGGKIMDIYSPQIRDEPLFRGFNNILKRIEFNCGLSYGTISDPQMIEKTAEEIRASKQRQYSTVADIQKALQTALEQLVDAMDVWATLGQLAPAGAYEMSFDWNDSIIDPETQRMHDKEDVRDGIMQPWEYRVKWYGEDEATARKKAPERLTDNEYMGFGRLGGV